MGQQSAELLQNVIKSAAGKSSGVFASALGVVTLLLTASGMFGEIQSALNAIWEADSKGSTLYRLLRARAASLGLVAALGFLLLVSLVISAALSALSDCVNAYLPFDGAAGALIVALLWIDYSAQIFLLGAEFTKVYAHHHGSQQPVPQAADMNEAGRRTKLL